MSMAVTTAAQGELRELPAISTAKQVSDFTQISLPVLARKRADGTGPNVLRIGRSVRYRREDVLAWLQSLSEPG